MAQTKLRRKENVSGDFFVDESCIDCDLCRQIAPQIFEDIGDQSAVARQPSTPEEELLALKALISCPTASIGASGAHPARKAVDSFPELIEQNVYFCGFASASSYGASSYLIVHPKGNILIDSPRFNLPLARRIEQRGGIRFILLTHIDDVADHQKWKDHFSAERIMHRKDSRSLPIEQLIGGDEAVPFLEDLQIIPTPGHTRGHLAFLYQNRYLFSGDHLWWSPFYKGLHASSGVCWHSWEEQIRSMERLLAYDFCWVLPGHGRRYRAETPAKMRQELQDCVARMKQTV